MRREGGEEVGGRNHEKKSSNSVNSRRHSINSMHFENKMFESAETSFKKHGFAKTKYETVASICAFCIVYLCKVEIFMVFAFEAESG